MPVELSDKGRILVCGSVYWKDEKIIQKALKSVNRGATIIHGGCPGVAKIADKYAKLSGLKVAVFRPETQKYGLKAGDYRNKVLITRGRPDLVLAFSSKEYPLQGELKIIEHARNKNIEVVYVY